MCRLFGATIAASQVRGSENLDLFLCFFYALVVMGIIERLFGPALFRRLRNNDTLTGLVKPRPFGIAFSLWNELCFVTMACLAILNHFTTFAFVFVLLSIAHGMYMVQILSTRLEYESNRLSYKSCFRNREIYLSQIRNARWDAPSRSFGYHLVLTLHDGSEISLSQIYFIGLVDLWENFGM